MQPSFAWIPPPPLNWSTFPLLLPAVAFGLGIGAANWISYWWPPYAPLALLTLAFCCVFLVLKRWKSPTTRQVISITLLCLIALTGYWRASSFHLPNQPAFFGHFLAKGEGNTLLVSIKDIKPGERHLRLISSVKAVIKDQKASSTKGELIIYLPPDRRAGELVPGDQLMLRGEIGTVENPRNPEAFNFATYWGKKNIFHRVFIRDPMQWQMVQEGSPNLLHAAKILRERWIASFRPYLTGNELAVAAALVLGKRDLLSDEIRSAYADTGAVHVLAVSGLHVGIVAWVVSWLLGRVIPKRYWARYVRTGLSIVFVWAFALLTGFGPSVQRAAWMFSILLLGGALRRKTYLFNSLAAAALLMLLMDPLQLFQVGFQLSFGAVAGIGLFQQKIQKALYFPNKIARLVWSTLSVSLAAQIGILPLSIYYFHQFPTYFLLTGSIVILTAYGALIIGLLHGIIAW
ncbi:MAG: ComEC/Rec2 family competence protein, partial [Bacteroidota bacterium]